MGNYKEMDGNLIEMFKKGEFEVIAHGCNCYATMGAGIALTIGKEFPEAKEADENLEIPNGIKRLGKLSYAEIDIDKKTGYDLSLVFNLYSQYNPGPDFRIKGFTKALKEMAKVIKKEFTYINAQGKKEYSGSDVRIGLPLIGCGIAGGDWNEVSEIVKEVLSGFDVTVIHFKEKVLGVNFWPEPKAKELGWRKKPKVDWHNMSDEEFSRIMNEDY